MKLAFNTKRGDYFVQCTDTNSRIHGITKNQGNMLLPKETNKAPVNDPTEMEINVLHDKEFKIIFLE